MKSFYIAWKDFLIRIKDRKGILTMLVTPLILTAILGMALEGVMGNTGSLPDMTVGIVVPNDDQLAMSFKEEVLAGVEFITLKTAENREELETWVTEESVDVGVNFPEQWSSMIAEGKLKEVEVLGSADHPLQASVLESLTQTFAEQALTVATSTATVLEDVSGLPIVANGQLDINEYNSELIGTLETPGDVTIKEAAVGEERVTSMQYYAAGMAVMFLLFNATLGAKSVIQERSTETLARLIATPTSKGAILLGKFLGTLLFAVVQMSIFFTATTLFFDVSWGNNLGQVVVVGFAYAVAVSGLSMILAAFVSSERTADSINGIGVQMFAVLGGSMLPIYVFPDSLRMIANITPNKWALVSFLDIMGGTDWQALWGPIILLTLMGLVSLIIGTWRLRVR